VGQRARDLLREIAQTHETRIYDGSINRDHVHMLIGIPPHLSESRAVQYIKGKSSHKLLSEYQSLRKRYWGPTSLGVGAIGWRPAATSRTRYGKKYVEDQKPEVPNDPFNVV
jgi:putative transposase